jgi:hypothetical protein
MSTISGECCGEDERIAEALRRAADFDSDPDFGISLEPLEASFNRLRRR